MRNPYQQLIPKHRLTEEELKLVKNDAITEKGIIIPYNATQEYLDAYHYYRQAEIKAKAEFEAKKYHWSTGGAVQIKDSTRTSEMAYKAPTPVLFLNPYNEEVKIDTDQSSYDNMVATTKSYSFTIESNDEFTTLNVYYDKSNLSGKLVNYLNKCRENISKSIRPVYISRTNKMKVGNGSEIEVVTGFRLLVPNEWATNEIDWLIEVMEMNGFDYTSEVKSVSYVEQKQLNLPVTNKRWLIVTTILTFLFIILIFLL